MTRERMPPSAVIVSAAKRSAAIWRRMVHQIDTSLALLAMTLAADTLLPRSGNDAAIQVGPVSTKRQIVTSSFVHHTENRLPDARHWT